MQINALEKVETVEREVTLTAVAWDATEARMRDALLTQTPRMRDALSSPRPVLCP
jgi:hypothetical protein